MRILELIKLSIVAGIEKRRVAVLNILIMNRLQRKEFVERIETCDEMINEMINM